MTRFQKQPHSGGKPVFEMVGNSVDLVDLIQSKGITLKKRGAQFVGLCPFHRESTPSLSVSRDKGLFHCFGCGASGDAISFLQKLGGLSFADAKRRLDAAPAMTRAVTVPTAGVSLSSAESAALLRRVVDFYHARLAERPQAVRYLESRGLADKDLIPAFHIGFADGSLLRAFGKDGEVKDALVRLGLLTELAADSGAPRLIELMRDCVVVPVFDTNGNVAELYGRDIKPASTFPHRYLPGPHRGVFNYQAAAASRDLILAECIIDALTLWRHGFKNVIAAFGAHGFTDDCLALVRDNQTARLFVAFDPDDAGDKGAAAVAERVTTAAPSCQILRVALPDGLDLNEYFQSGRTTDDFAALLKHAAPMNTPGTDSKPAVAVIDGGLDLAFGNPDNGARRYRVRGIPRALSASLRVNLRAGRNGHTHIDTADLYLERARQSLASRLAELFGVEESVTTADLLSIVSVIESHQADQTLKDNARPDPEPMNDHEKAAALAFLRDPDLMRRILDDFDTIGLVGETINKEIGYIIAVSRKLQKPLSGVVVSRAAAGKSTLLEKIVDLCPPEDVVRYTRITAQALFYKGKTALKHKLLVIEEQQGASGADYALRILQSGQNLLLSAPTTNPETGRIESIDYEAEGPLAYLASTTSAARDFETATRGFELTADESVEQTERIQKAQRRSRTLRGLLAKRNGDAITRRHQNAQRLLDPVEVCNPFADQLTFPADILTTRREQEKYLSLIEAITFLHQHQRPRKHVQNGQERVEYVESTPDDIRLANSLISAVLSQTMEDLSAPSATLLSEIERMVEDLAKKERRPKHDIQFSRRQIREWTRWSDFQIREHIGQLEQLEYLAVAAGKQGKRYLYQLQYKPRFSTDPVKNGLVDPDSLVKSVA